MSNVDIWTLRIFSLIEQCPGTASRCDHTSWFLRLELQRAGDSPHAKSELAWGCSSTGFFFSRPSWVRLCGSFLATFLSPRCPARSHLPPSSSPPIVSSVPPPSYSCHHSSILAFEKFRRVFWWWFRIQGSNKYFEAIQRHHRQHCYFCYHHCHWCQLA